MKKQKRTVILLVLAALAFICTNFVACKNGSGDAGAQNEQEQTEVKTEIPVVSLKTIAIGEYSEQEKSAIIKIFPNSEFSTELSAVNESHKVVINDYEDLPDNIADDAYYILYEIQKNEIEDVVDDKDDEYWENVWNEENIANVKKELNICPYTFIGYNPNKNASFYISSVSSNSELEAVRQYYNSNLPESLVKDYAIPQFTDFDDIPEIEEISASDEEANDDKGTECLMDFSNVAYWILEVEKNYSENDINRAESAIRAIEKETKTSTIDISKISETYTITRGCKYYPYEAVQRKKTDVYFIGSGSWTVSMRYTPIIVSGSSGSNQDGMYFFVEATIWVANKDLMTIKEVKDGKGNKGYIAGLCLKKLDINIYPKVYDSTQKRLSILFPDGYTPKPETINENTSYSYSDKYKIHFGAKVYGSKSGETGLQTETINGVVKTKSQSGTKWEVGGELSGGWEHEWGQEYKRDIKDYELRNCANFDFDNTSNSRTDYLNYVLKVNNLPKWGDDTAKNKKFSEGATALYSTIFTYESWAWFVPGTFKVDDGKGNVKVTLPTINLTILGNPLYSAFWHWSDTIEHEYSIGYMLSNDTNMDEKNYY